mmetsp:Transcript_79730/g.140641  ORF Transcript_79730/g.140641 Transcript_79730/m.140641 type:complete len:81 (-) Transcript_79730:115-357(-)
MWHQRGVSSKLQFEAAGGLWSMASWGLCSPTACRTFRAKNKWVASHFGRCHGLLAVAHLHSLAAYPLPSPPIPLSCIAFL